LGLEFSTHKSSFIAIQKCVQVKDSLFLTSQIIRHQ